MSYIYLMANAPQREYSFSTSEGRSARVVVPTTLNLDSASLTVEVSRSSAFKDVIVSGFATYREGEIVINFTSEEVDALRDGYYRVKSVQDGQLSILLQGSVTFIPFDGIIDTGGLLDMDGAVKVQFIEPLTAALEEIFLKKEDYVAGVVDPVVLNQAVDNKLHAHIVAANPHDAYDVDMQSLAVLFENRLI